MCQGNHKSCPCLKRKGCNRIIVGATLAVALVNTSEALNRKGCNRIIVGATLAVALVNTSESLNGGF